MLIGASTLTFWNCIPTSPKPPSFVWVWLRLPATATLLEPETFWLMPIGAGAKVGVATVAAAGVAGQTVGAGVSAATGLWAAAIGRISVRRPSENTNRIAAMRTKLRQAGVCQRWTVDMVSLR